MRLFHWIETGRWNPADAVTLPEGRYAEAKLLSAYGEALAASTGDLGAFHAAAARLRLRQRERLAEIEREKKTDPADRQYAEIVVRQIDALERSAKRLHIGQDLEFQTKPLPLHPWFVEIVRPVARRELSLRGSQNSCTQLLTQRSVLGTLGIMKVAGIRELRSKTAELLGGDEPLLVTRHGKISGLYLPLEDANRLPQDLRRELGQVLSAHLAKQLAAGGWSEKEIHEDFDAFRRRRR